MKDQADGVELAQEMEGDGVGAWFPYHIIWAQVLFREFLGWSPGSEELHLDIGLVTNFYLRSLCPVLVRIFPIPLLGLCYVFLQLCLDAFQVCHKCLCFG